MTDGYQLAARNVIHTVGPRYNIKYHTAAETALHYCYRWVLFYMYIVITVVIVVIEIPLFEMPAITCTPNEFLHPF